MVKVLLEADLVRHMDRRILASAGAYQDRSEFIAEAIRDRLTEEAALVEQVEPADRVAPASDSSSVAREKQPKPKRVAEEPVRFMALEPPDLDDSAEMGHWRRSGHIPSTQVGPTDTVNFGLHNRDLPTLWALDRLALMAGETGEPVEWERFTNRLRGEGSHLGALLRHRDLAAPVSLGAGIGFPKPGAKQQASVERFIAAAVGNNRRADGPFFALALAAFADPDRTRIIPSEPGLAVLHDMLERGLGPTLPQPPAAFECWWRYIARLAPAEHAAWRKLLRVVADEPTRDELITRFPEWPGHVATTNTVGFIARSREWGLMAPELIEQRYHLTELGQVVAREE
jgi:hypothetical protein